MARQRGGDQAQPADRHLRSADTQPVADRGTGQRAHGGGQDNAIKDLREVVFKGRPCKSPQVADDGSMKVIEI